MKKWIGYYEDIISPVLCDKIINYTEIHRRFDFNESTYSNHKGVIKSTEMPGSHSRDNAPVGQSRRPNTIWAHDRVKMEEVWFREGEKFYIDFKAAFNKVIREYSNEHELFSCKRHTDFRLNKYPTGGFMSKHCDNIHHSHGQEYGFPQVSALLFLNDDYEGGEFVVADEVYNIKKGSGIIFPSNFMFPHEVKTITKGIRWSVLTWLM